MALEPNKNRSGAGNADRAKMMRVLIPAGAIALVVVLAAVVASLSGSTEHKMSDGSNGSANDPDLKQIMAGVQYRDIKEGEGTPCPPGVKVKVHYTGWLTDNTVFDTSKGKGPVVFELGGVIPGWQVGIPDMKPGGIRKLVIAPDKAYGDQVKGKIPPGSTLIFEVELLDVLSEHQNVSTGTGKPLSDGSNGGTDDPGLTDLGEGLKYRDVKEGTGEAVKPGADVTVHYTGWTVDGKVFDSSRKGDKPFTCSLAPNTPRGVIPGWQKGIPGMKPGGIRKLVIPPGMAYGSSGAGANIPPNATLIFEVELIK